MSRIGSLYFMEHYQGIHLQIRLPEPLSNSNTLSNILHTTRKISDHVELQLDLAKLAHTIFQQLSNNMNMQCGEFEGQYQSNTGNNSLVCKQLIKTIHLAFKSMHHLAFKHQVDLKTISKREKEESLIETISDKIDKIKEKIEVYRELYKEYEEKEKVYISKSQKISGICKNPIRYYSLELRNKEINKIISLEYDLQKILLKLQSQKSVIQLLYKATYKLLKQLLLSKVKKICDIIGLVFLTLTSLFSTQDVIIEESSKDYITNLSQEHFENQIASPQQAIEAAKKLLQGGKVIRNIFGLFLESTIKVLEVYEKKSNDSVMKKRLITIQRERDLVEETIQAQIYCEGTYTPKLISLFQNFIEKLIYKLKGHNNIFKYKTMQEDLFERLQKQLNTFTNSLPNGSTIRDNKQLYDYYIEMSNYLKKKYYKQAEDINNLFREDVLLLSKQFQELLKYFLGQFKTASYSPPSQQNMQALVKLILSSNFYKVFKDPFIMKQDNYQFVRSPHVNLFLKCKSEVQLNDLSFDLSNEIKVAKTNCFGNSFCCGIKSENEYKEFNCALVDKILLQGKLKFFKKHIQFTSLFNKTTLFGKTQLNIPAREIIKISKKKQALNGIVIETQCGPLSFINFVNNPLPFLLSNYKFKQMNKLTTSSNIFVQPIIPKAESLRSKIINSLVYLGYYLNNPKTLSKILKDRKQTAFLQQELDILNVKVQYQIEYDTKQIYHFRLLTKYNKLNLQYSLGESTTRQCKQYFLVLIRQISDKIEANIHNTRSQIFDLSSILEDKSTDSNLKKGDIKNRKRYITYQSQKNNFSQISEFLNQVQRKPSEKLEPVKSTKCTNQKDFGITKTVNSVEQTKYPISVNIVYITILIITLIVLFM